MSLIFFDGFDDGLSLKNKWSSYENISIGPSYGRNGDGAYLNHGAPDIALLTKSLDATEEDDVLVLGFAMKLSNLSVVNWSYLLSFRSDGGTTGHVGVRLTDAYDGAGLTFYRGGIVGTLLGGCPFGLDVWRYCEIKVKLHNTVGYIVVHIDGEELLNLQNIDTFNSAGIKTVLDHVQFRAIDLSSDGKPDIYIDDVYLLNEQGARNNDFLNDCRVESLYPNANGNYSQFDSTPGGNNYETVDENPPVDADYVEGDSSAEKDSYGFENLSGPGGIAGVQVQLYGKTDDMGVRDVKALTRQSGADYLGDTITFNGTARCWTQLWEDNPADAAQWEPADINNGEFGMEVV